MNMIKQFLLLFLLSFCLIQSSIAMDTDMTDANNKSEIEMDTYPLDPKVDANSVNVETKKVDQEKDSKLDTDTISGPEQTKPRRSKVLCHIMRLR